MTVKFLDLIHIEISVPDAEKAYQILHNVFGAEKVQEEFAGFLNGEYNKVIHVGLGDVVLQFMKDGVNLFQQTRYTTGRDNLIGPVSPMLHIELVTPDLEKTYELLHKVFGSEKVEIKFADLLDTPFMRMKNEKHFQICYLSI